MATYEGNLIAHAKKFGIVVSRFNEFITKKLLEGALDAFIRHGAKEEDIDIYWTPGSFEIPLVLKRIAEKKRYHALLALGAVIQGDTPHFQYIATQVARGISSVSLQTGVPIAFGILTTESVEQAIERAGVKRGNKGFHAALSAIEMSNLLAKIE